MFTSELTMFIHGWPVSNISVRLSHYMYSYAGSTSPTSINAGSAAKPNAQFNGRRADIVPWNGVSSEKGNTQRW